MSHTSDKRESNLFTFQYIANFTRKFGLTLLSVKDGLKKRLGIWTGREFVFEESDWYIANVVNVLWRYGFAVPVAQTLSTETRDKFLQLYEMPQTWKSVEEWYEALGILET